MSMTKEEKYRALLPQVRALMEGEEDMIARMANMAALLHRAFGFWWTGFYRVAGGATGIGGSGSAEASAGGQTTGGAADASGSCSPAELVLGPFQGPPACTHIAFGRGVCGTAWQSGRTIVVPDVEQFPGHIACSSESRSEIVVPVRDAAGGIIAVLDIDSEHLATFDDIDRRYLEEAVSYLI